MPSPDRAKRLEANHDHYETNKSYYRDRNALRRRQLAELVQLVKSQPCVDCGQKYPYYVMDLDHRGDETKVLDVSRLVARRVTVVRLEAEIAKCDVVCSNCHRERTHQREQVAITPIDNPQGSLFG